MGKNDLSPLRNLAIISQLGLIMIIPIFGGVIFGNYLDGKFSNGNTYLIIFTIVGVLTAFRNLYVIGTRSAKKEGKNKDE